MSTPRSPRRHRQPRRRPRIPATPRRSRCARHLGHAIASEWTKIRSVRSTMWTLGVFVLLVVGIGLLAGAVVAADSSASSLGGQPAAPGFLRSAARQHVRHHARRADHGLRVRHGHDPYDDDRLSQPGRVLAAKAIVFFLSPSWSPGAAVLVVAVQTWPC